LACRFGWHLWREVRIAFGLMRHCIRCGESKRIV
jgi:hypothetical protein